MFQGYRKAIVLSTRRLLLRTSPITVLEMFLFFCRLALILCPCGRSKRIRMIDAMPWVSRPSQAGSEVVRWIRSCTEDSAQGC